MKSKLLSLIMVIVLIAVQLTIPVAVSAEEVSIPDPVFTLDLSEYTNENQVIKNGVTDSADGIYVRNASGQTPNVKNYYTPDGEKVQVFQTANDTATYTETTVDTLGAIEVETAKINELLGENKDKAMTVTFWAMNYERQSNSGTVALAKNNDRTPSSFTIWSAKESDVVAFNGTDIKPGATSYTFYKRGVDWRFYAISKEWTDSEAGDGTGTWTYTLQCNDMVYPGNMEEVTYADTSEMSLQIGARFTSDNALKTVMRGEIAGVTVYNEALTSDQLASIRTAENCYSDLTAEADMPQTFTQTAVTDGAVKNVSLSADTVEIEFNNYVDGATLSGVTLKDASGNTLEGSSVTKDGKKVLVSYPALTEGASYTLSITDALKSVNGISATPATMTLNASYANSLVFSMDLSQYDTTTQTIKNGVTSDSTGVHAINYSDTQKPTVKKYYDSNGEPVYAFQSAAETFDTADATTRQLGGIEVEKEKINELLGTAGDKAMTVTFWSKAYTRETASHNYGIPLTYSVGIGEATTTSRISTWSQKQYSSFKVAGEKQHTKDSLPVDTWIFNAVSMSWTDSETTEGKGTWSYDGYLHTTYFSGTTSEMSFLDNSTLDMRIGAGLNADDTFSRVFQGEIAGFRVYNSDLSKEQLDSIKTAQNYTALTAEADMPQTLELVTATDGMEISPYQQDIELEFNNVLDPATVESGIKMYDFDGNPVNISVSSSSKTATVTFGDLIDNKTYTLEINQNLKSVNDKAVADTNINVNTDSLVAELTFGADADNRPTDTAFNFLTENVSGDKSEFTVMEEDGVNFIRIQKTAQTTDTWLCYDFDEAQTDSFVMDFKIRIANGTKAPGRTIGINRTATTTAGTATRITNMSNFSNLGSPSTDDQGFAHLRYEFDYLGDNTWRVTKYDRLIDGLHARTDVRDHSVYHQTTISAGLKNVGFSLWVYEEAADATWTDIAEFKVYRKSNWYPVVTVTDADGYIIGSLVNSGTYTVTMEPREIASNKFGSDTDDMYAYYAVYETDASGDTRLIHVVGGQMKDYETFTGSFTLEKQTGCTYTAKCMMWRDEMTPLIDTINWSNK